MTLKIKYLERDKTIRKMLIINGIPSERRVPASCSYIEIEDIWKGKTRH